MIFSIYISTNISASREFSGARLVATIGLGELINIARDELRHRGPQQAAVARGAGEAVAGDGRAVILASGPQRLYEHGHG